MMQTADENVLSDHTARCGISRLMPQCEKCFGLCCTALYFSKLDGFPADKNAGTPCIHLNEDFRCAVHGQLGALGLKGCAAYECFGAGQQVSQVTFSGKSWRAEPSLAGVMFDTFLIMRQLHEICWYLYEALQFRPNLPMCEEIGEALRRTERVAQYDPRSLIEFDLSGHCIKISGLLKNAGRFMRQETARTEGIPFHPNKERKSAADYFGKDLRKKDLRCADLRGACLIAANLEGVDLSGTDLTGADFRDADLRGANLSKSIFLTQSQANAARGDLSTRLPVRISRPAHWKQRAKLF